MQYCVCYSYKSELSQAKAILTELIFIFVSSIFPTAWHSFHIPRVFARIGWLYQLILNKLIYLDLHDTFLYNVHIPIAPKTNSIIYSGLSTQNVEFVFDITHCFAFESVRLGFSIKSSTINFQSVT